MGNLFQPNRLQPVVPGNCRHECSCGRITSTCLTPQKHNQKLGYVTLKLRRTHSQRLRNNIDDLAGQDFGSPFRSPSRGNDRGSQHQNKQCIDGRCALTGGIMPFSRSECRSDRLFNRRDRCRPQYPQHISRIHHCGQVSALAVMEYRNVSAMMPAMAGKVEEASLRLHAMPCETQVRKLLSSRIGTGEQKTSV